jgi:adenylate cyclase
VLRDLQLRIPDLLGLRRGAPALVMRIGLATGDVVVGSVGSPSARSFTVMGDTVNFSSRLEGANKVYGTGIMIDAETREQAGARIVARELDAIAVLGRDEPVHVFELIGMAGEVPAIDVEALSVYAEGLADYRAGRWDGALARFGQVLELRPADTPSAVMIERTTRLRASTPDNWDGVFRFTAK